MNWTNNAQKSLAVAAGDDCVSVDWAVDLTKKFRDELGGINAGTLQHHAKLGHLSILRGEDQNLAAFVTKPGNSDDHRIFPIIAAAVPADLQRMHLGMLLLDRIDARFELARDRIFQAICRQDLPSNLFWAAAGFTPVAVRHSSSTRGKPCIIWRRRVDRSVVGIDAIVPASRPRMGGGRFLPSNRPDLGMIYQNDQEAIGYALQQSGAVPIVGRFAGLGALNDVRFPRPTVDRPPRPNDPQMSLFAAGRASTECFRR